jgi:uncharacterized protein (DUF4415 family)
MAGEPLSKKDQQLVENLRQIPDSAIDFSDISEVTANTFQNRSGVREALKSLARQVTLMLDPDVAAWIKKDSPAIQRRINSALRQMMEHDQVA